LRDNIKTRGVRTIIRDISWRKNKDR
jgi:hypothetical protein